MTDWPKCPTTDKACYTKAEAKQQRPKVQRLNVGHISRYECPDAHLHPPGAGKFHLGHTPSKRSVKRKRRKPLFGPIGE